MKKIVHLVSMLAAIGACSDDSGDEPDFQEPDDASVAGDAGSGRDAGGPVAQASDAAADAALASDASHTATGDAAATTPPHWEYGEADGPEPLDGPSHWYMLDPAWQICMDAMHQSPIDLPSSMTVEDLPDVVPHYGPSHVAIVNNGHTIQYNYDMGSTISIGDASYSLVQFHFHAPSEHSVDGVSHALELHLVHRDSAGKLAVLGVFLDQGALNETLAAASWSSLPSSGTYDNGLVQFNIEALVPPGPTYRYDGSLTTPPCSEGVSWFVKRTPITLSADQLAKFTTLFPLDARPKQDRGSRVVHLGE
jgi:carbonic anhydrase